VGASAQWTRPLGTRQRLLLGAEGRHVSGTTEETGYARGAATSTLEAGGEETGGAVYAQDQVQAHSRLFVSASLRLDAWALREARSTTTPLATGVAATTGFPDRDETHLSPRLGLLFRARRGLSLSASGYGAFRAPTLNELYRSFRVGDTLTLANPALEPERLWGGEAGALASFGRHALRLTAFSAEVEDAVANVTVASVPGLVTRERRNVGRTRSRGFEAEADLRLGARSVLTAGYAFTDARVLSFPADPALEGRQVRRRSRRATRAACGSGCRRASRERPGRTTATSWRSTGPRSSICSPATR
jgi:outer membrane receptor protein involved in Fe transport